MIQPGDVVTVRQFYESEYVDLGIAIIIDVIGDDYHFKFIMPDLKWNNSTTRTYIVNTKVHYEYKFEKMCDVL